MRHKANSTVYQVYYHNSRMNAVVQDAFLGRGTESPYLAVLNHMGLRRDENAPKAVSEEEMRAIGPSSAIRQLEPKAENLRTELCKKYGRPSLAPDKEKADYTGILSQLRTARQKHRRKVLRMLHKNHFNEADESELQKQLQGIHEPIAEKDVIHTLQERKRLVDILGDMDDDLSEEDIVRRKIEAINAMVAYSRICEPLQREQPELKTKKAPVPSQSPFPMIEPGIRSDTDPIQGKPRPSEQTHPTSASRSTVPHSRHSDARHRLGSATPI